mgnify:CR=1 FL=1
MPYNYKELGLVNTKEMFKKANENGYAVPAFNFNNLEQVLAIMEACAEMGSPVILQCSKEVIEYLGINMIREARKTDDCCTEDGCSSKALLALGIATSIDALAIGFTFSFLKDFNIFISSGEIGIITFIISAAGVVLGTKFGTLLESKAQYLGGIILIIIGIKSLAGNFA